MSEYREWLLFLMIVVVGLMSMLTAEEIDRLEKRVTAAHGEPQ